MSAAQRSVPRARSATRSGSPGQEFLVIGQIVAPRGLRGELKVRVETDDPGRFSELASVHLGPNRVRYAVAGARLHNGYALLVLEGISDRDAADALRGLTVYVDPEQALPLADDEYYQFQVEGLSVRDQDGLDLGRLTEVLETGANDVYVVAGPAGELLLPAIKDVILNIDIAGGTMTVRVPEGLTD